MKHVVILFASLFTLSACARNMSSEVYSSSTSVGKVVYGTVVSARAITIKDNDQIGKNGAGVLAGGALGAAAGSGAGKGSGKTTATVGGALAGAVVGALVQDQLSSQPGMEYIVRLEGKPVAPTKKTKKTVNLRAGDEISNEVNDSAELVNTSTETISVIQDDSVILSPGQRVMVVYRDDRARLQPAY